MKVKQKNISYKDFVHKIEKYAMDKHRVSFISIDNDVYLSYLSEYSNDPIIISKIDLDICYEDVVMNNSMKNCYKLIDTVVNDFIDYLLENMFKENNYYNSKRYMN